MPRTKINKGKTTGSSKNAHDPSRRPVGTGAVRNRWTEYFRCSINTRVNQTPVSVRISAPSAASVIVEKSCYASSSTD
ncbi:hypothetical protein DPMN_074817 [Dreissena polymorpha]|uniref:Uncharacterized protein n=1 Tax=Dreissena polymorpha TaxID=45954 RepID=A0A9D4BED2_DREPO|nr:hypothetical protein DPMN_074817 [Dreissena polymorpha]